MTSTYKRLTHAPTSNSLEIKTKSIETILVPLVTQISTLVHFKEKSRLTSEKKLPTISRVGEGVFSAVERFVSVGVSIGNENPDIQNDLTDACREARLAGESIQQITSYEQDASTKSPQGKDRQSMVQAARALLSAVTRVLILADTVVVKQIIVVKKKVNATLNRLESATSFSDFMKLFAVYGAEMVDLAHLTGDRQTDLKDERRRSQLSASRTILEKFTMLILTSSKVFLRHHHCVHARQCRDLVFSQVRRALDMVQLIVVDSGSTTLNKSSSNVTALLTKDEMNFVKSLRQFEYAIEMLKVSTTSTTSDELKQLCTRTIEHSQDFTDAMCISTDERERILQYHRQMQNRLKDLLESISDQSEYSTIIENLQQISRDFRRQLEQIAIFRASEFFRTHDDFVLLNDLKTAALTNRSDSLNESIEQFREQSDIVIELSKLLRHVSSCDPLQVSSEYHDTIFQNLSQMILSSIQSLSIHSNSRVAKENFDALCRIWQDQMNDFAVLVKEIQDQIEGRGEKNVYLSLPRPGKQSAPSKVLTATKLDKDEQGKIAQVGLEVKLITAEMDAEAEKWNESNNEIIKRAKNLSSMAYSMHLFTRGEGTLRTTDDLFTQAFYFVEEGTRLITVVKRPTDSEAVKYFDQIPLICHQLKLKLKTSVSGKLATFAKVEAVICETRDLMQAVTRLCIALFSDPTNQRLTTRPPVVPSKRAPLNRTTSIDRTSRSTSLQRPTTYLPTVDHI